MIVAVDQPNYIPWKGYFDLIHDVDLFVFYNDVQYTVRDWRNRNKIITPEGEKWLSVPCGRDTKRLICEVKTTDSTWQRVHYETLKYAYHKAPFFDKYKDFLEHVYLERTWEYLHELDQFMTVHIAQEFLGIKTEFSDSRDYETKGTKHTRLLSLLDAIGENIIYESGPLAKDYIVSSDYSDHNIGLRWKSYDGYPAYPQSSDSCVHTVSILDLLFNVGDDAPYYIWGWREDSDIPSWVY